MSQGSKYKKSNQRIPQIWQSLTKPVATDIDDARVEYMTKVILTVLNLVVIPFLLMALIGWLFHVIPVDTVIILAIMMVLFISGWWLANKGYPRIGGSIPCLLLFATGAYGNYVGGIDAPAMLLYGLAIVLAAIILGRALMFVVLGLSLLSYIGLGLAHYNGLLITARSAETMFINRVSIVTATLTAITLGVWFLKHQYQNSINESRNAEANTRALLETIIDGVVYSDGNGLVVDLNTAAVQMFKLPSKEVALGRNIVEFMLPEDRKAADELHDKIIANSITGSMKCTGVLPTGETIYVEINTALYRDSSGKPNGFVSTIRDITQRKLVEDELLKYREQLENLVTERTAKLKEAYDELESFSYSISHDLRSPLRSINGFISLISTDPENTLTDESRRFIKQIIESSNRMGELISDLLAFSRLIRQPISRVQVNPEDLVREVKEELLNGEYHTLNCEIQIDPLPACQADPILLRQVFFNLMENACKYAQKREKALIKVGAKVDQDGGTVYFISDNGIGFDMKYAEKLFGVFQRLHNEKDYQGTGIGLATVQRIIRRHNGQIWVESKKDEGATFYFTVPNPDIIIS